MADARITQLVVETLSSLAPPPIPATRVSQLVVETLSSLAPPAIPGTRVTQLVVETLSRVVPAGTAERVDSFVWMPG